MLPLARAAALAVAVAGCSSGGVGNFGADFARPGDGAGGGDLSRPGDAGAEDLAAAPDLAAEDLAAPPDLARPPDLTAPPDLARGPDLAQDCDGPEDCGGGTPICCADVAIGAGNPPACPIQSIMASCRASCQTMLPLQCPAMGRARLCHKAADCPDPNYPHCCRMDNGGTPITACVNNLYRAFATQCF